MIAIDRSPAPRVLQFRDVDGRVLSTTWGGTTCLNPRPLSKYAAVSDDGEQEHAIRCRDCAGCREYERRELCKLLDTHYASQSEAIWLVIVECPLSMQTLLAARLHRVSGCAFEPCFYRLGVEMFALTAVGRSPRPSALRTLNGYRVTVRRVQRGRGKRAWNLLTWGMLTPRAYLGRDLNRFYHRGIAKAERLKWNVRWRGGMRTRHPWLGRDAIAVRGEVGLYRGSEAALPNLRRVTRATRNGERAASGCAPSQGRRAGHTTEPRRSNLESAGTVLMGMMDRNYEVVPERGLPVNRRPLKAGVPSAMTEFRDAPAAHGEDEVNYGASTVGLAVLPPAPTATREPDLNVVKGRRYATSLHVTPAEFAAWGQRMAEKARIRGG